MKELEGLDVIVWDGVCSEPITWQNIALSHKNIVRWAKENNLPMVCIAEDDVKMTDPKSWDHFLKMMPEDFDLYLSGIYFGPIDKDNITAQFSGLHLYVVHSRFYDNFLAVDTSIYNLDMGMSAPNGPIGKFVVCNPFAAVQYDGFSYNVGNHMNYNHYLAGRRLYKSA
jgi:hypothetical protein